MSLLQPLVCDLRGAPDTPEQRLSAYRRVFAALVGREDRPGGFRFVFAADTADLALLSELVKLEGACCPFLLITLRTVGCHVQWDCHVETAEAVPFMEALRDLPDALSVPPHLPTVTTRKQENR